MLLAGGAEIALRPYVEELGNAVLGDINLGDDLALDDVKLGLLLSSFSWIVCIIVKRLNSLCQHEISATVSAARIAAYPFENSKQIAKLVNVPEINAAFAEFPTSSCF